MDNEAFYQPKAGRAFLAAFLVYCFVFTLGAAIFGEILFFLLKMLFTALPSVGHLLTSIHIGVPDLILTSIAALLAYYPAYWVIMPIFKHIPTRCSSYRILGRCIILFKCSGLIDPLLHIFEKNYFLLHPDATPQLVLNIISAIVICYVGYRFIRTGNRELSNWEIEMKKIQNTPSILNDPET